MRSMFDPKIYNTKVLTSGCKDIENRKLEFRGEYSFSVSKKCFLKNSGFRSLVSLNSDLAVYMMMKLPEPQI